MGGQNKTTSARWACNAAVGGNHRNGTWKPLAVVHMRVCVRMQGGGRSQTKTPHPSVCSAVSIRGTELAVSQEVLRGLCCHFLCSTEEKEGLSQGSPRLTSNHIHGDFAQKTYQVRVSPPLFL